jgi:hypothetical protein
MHSLIRSAINIGGFGAPAGGQLPYSLAPPDGQANLALGSPGRELRFVPHERAFHSHVVQASAPPFGLDGIVGGSGTAHPEQLGVLTLNLALIGLLLESFSLLRLMRHEYR